MDALFTCPPPAALTAVPAQTCPERFDQVVRLFIQRKQSAPSFTATSILLQATWTPLLASITATKVIGTPLIPNMVIPTGEIIKEGGNDNTTINGIPKLAGQAFAPVTAQLQDANKDVRAALRMLASESAVFPGFTNLWAYFVNRFGQVIGSVNGSNVEGFPIYNFFVGDVGTEGLNKSNIANLSFDLEPGWSNNAVIYTPTDFNPVTL
jgi:hypothetical protein